MTAPDAIARDAVDRARDATELGAAWLLIVPLFAPAAGVPDVVLIPLTAAWVRRADAVSLSPEERDALSAVGRGPDVRTARACIEATS